MDNLITGDLAQHRAPVRRRATSTSSSSDVTEYIHVAGRARRDPALRLAGEPDRLPRAADPDAQGRLARHAQGARASRARRARASCSPRPPRCYGDPLVHPQPEDYWGNVNPVGPRGVYDEAKRFAEAMTMAYHRFHGVDTRIVRIFNTYGPRMRLNDGRALPAFMSQALRGEPLTVFGDGSQTRSFCYVDDLVEGIWRLLHSRRGPAGEHRQPARDDDPRSSPRRVLEADRLDARRSCSSRCRSTIPRCASPTSPRRSALLGWEPKVGAARTACERTLDVLPRARLGVGRATATGRAEAR